MICLHLFFFIYAINFLSFYYRSSYLLFFVSNFEPYFTNNLYNAVGLYTISNNFIFLSRSLILLMVYGSCTFFNIKSISFSAFFHCFIRYFFPIYSICFCCSISLSYYSFDLFLPLFCIYFHQLSCCIFIFLISQYDVCLIHYLINYIVYVISSKTL